VDSEYENSLPASGYIEEHNYVLLVFFVTAAVGGFRKNAVWFNLEKGIYVFTEKFPEKYRESSFGKGLAKIAKIIPHIILFAVRGLVLCR